jgi:hypothetical protein
VHNISQKVLSVQWAPRTKQHDPWVCATLCQKIWLLRALNPSLNFSSPFQKLTNIALLYLKIFNRLVHAQNMSLNYILSFLANFS